MTIFICGCCGMIFHRSDLRFTILKIYQDEEWEDLTEATVRKGRKGMTNKGDLIWTVENVVYSLYFFNGLVVKAVMSNGGTRREDYLFFPDFEVCKDGTVDDARITFELPPDTMKLVNESLDFSDKTKCYARVKEWEHDHIWNDVLKSYVKKGSFYDS